MPPIPEETKRLQSLLTSLVVVSLMILALVLVIAGYPTVIKPLIAPATPLLPSPRSSSTLTLVPTVTPTPSPTSTLRYTLTPSITPTPTETLSPTVTLTPPGPATLTPAQPVRADPYKLGEWEAEQANVAVALMNDYPNSLLERERGEDNAGFYQAFHYAVLAAREALMRFPEAPQADGWRRDLAYNLAQTGSPLAGQAYADWLVQNLNQGNTDPNALIDWFNTQEPRLSLGIIPLKPPSGYLGSYLVEIHGPGSAFIWLLESSSGFQAYPLYSNFDFVNAADMRSVVSDLTGDGYEEAAVYNSTPQGTLLEKPRVFSLSKVPAQELFLQPTEPPFNVGIEYRNLWRADQASSSQGDLVFESEVFDPCPTTIQRFYHWDGNYFDLNYQQVDLRPVPATLFLCEFIIDQAAAHWGPGAAVQVIEQLLPLWPPETDSQGKPYPADAKDELRYRQGIAYALAGSFDDAQRVLNDLVASPTISTSRWVEPAAQFLAAYQKPEQLYPACLASKHCDAEIALGVLLNQVYTANDAQPGEQDPVEFLSQSGVTLRSSGYFDFDGDEQKERWFTVQHRPLEKLYLWILAATPEGRRALPAGQLEGDQVNPQFLDEEARPPLVQLEGQLSISMPREPLTSEPYLVSVTPQIDAANRLEATVVDARQAIFVDDNPAKALKLLSDLEAVVTPLCRTNLLCDEYFYLLGLSNELLGKERPAIEAYLRLWRDFARSPFAVLARLKLQPTIIPPTPTPTPTPTITPTLQPGAATPTGTARTPGAPTPTLPAGVTPSPTGGVGPYPQPTGFVTPNPYAGPTQTPYIGP